MGLFMSASDDSDLDSMSGEESVPGDSDSSMPLGDSQEENGNELPDSTDSEENELGSWEALIETGTLPGHAALAVQDHVAGEAAVDCRPNQPCLDPGDHTGQGDGRVLVNHTCSGDPGERGENIR